MSKRGAEKQLNYDNWDEPEEPVESEVFLKADESTMKARNVIVPRRKSTQPTTQAKLGLFKSFDAFSSNKSVPNGQPSSVTPNTVKNDDYLFKLATLNKEVSAWISKHVSEDPCCILTPIFSDYAKHLAAIDSSTSKSTTPTPQTDKSDNTEKGEKGVSIAKPALSAPSSNGFSFKFGQSSSDSATFSTPKPPLFFGLNSSSSTSSISASRSNLPVFSFGLSTTSTTTTATTPSTTLFSFAPKPLVNDALNATNAPAADDEEYVPPKPEVNEIKEEGSVYTVRCKLFYKSKDQWIERGLGNLHIIPDGEDKFQMLVRADTNLGHILLNILVTKDIPMQLQKNNLTFACVPSPPLPGSEKESSSTRPIPMLVRVKTTEAASALLQEIDKRRSQKVCE